MAIPPTKIADAAKQRTTGRSFSSDLYNARPFEDSNPECRAFCVILLLSAVEVMPGSIQMVRRSMRITVICNTAGIENSFSAGASSSLSSPSLPPLPRRILMRYSKYGVSLIHEAPLTSPTGREITAEGREDCEKVPCLTLNPPPLLPSRQYVQNMRKQEREREQALALQEKKALQAFHVSQRTTPSVPALVLPPKEKEVTGSKKVAINIKAKAKRKSADGDGEGDQRAGRAEKNAKLKVEGQTASSASSATALGLVDYGSSESEKE
jgi:hypothetical protein